MNRTRIVFAGLLVAMFALVLPANLFADAVQLCATKQPDDLRNLIAARIAEHDRQEAERKADEDRKAQAVQDAARQPRGMMRNLSPEQREKVSKMTPEER